MSSSFTELLQSIQHNCDISDAHDHDIYSMCTMVLKLRNLYKWEKGLQPWDDPAPADLLDWIDVKENAWAKMAGESFRPLSVAGKILDPLDVEAVNAALAGSGLVYGAGYGRSMKTVFFLAEEIEARSQEGCSIRVLGKESAREMASPFAMVQDGQIIVRRESLRFFFWDQIQDVRSSCRNSLQYALRSYGVFHDGVVDWEAFKASLDTMVDQEMNLFISHEIGEILQTDLDSGSLRAIIGHFPGSALEFVSRAVKDILADTDPRGPLASVACEQRDSSLAFYLTFLDGLRERLFPEIRLAWQQFQSDRNWGHIEEARRSCRTRSQGIAREIQEISRMIGNDPDDVIYSRFDSRIMVPLGLEKPKAASS